MGIIKIKQLEITEKIGKTGDSRLRGNDGKHGLLRADALAKTTRTDRSLRGTKQSGKQLKIES
jgi:hypothetical protein